MKNLGYENAWSGYISYPDGWDKPGVVVPGNPPPEWVACQAAGHTPEIIAESMHNTSYACHICGIRWQVDSSG